MNAALVFAAVNAAFALFNVYGAWRNLRFAKDLRALEQHRALQRPTPGAGGTGGTWDGTGEPPALPLTVDRAGDPGDIWQTSYGDGRNRLN